MSARAATPASSYSKGLILAVLVDRNELSLRELVLCFVSCKAFKQLLDGRGFCIGTAWLWSCLESGQRPGNILSRLRRARGSPSLLAYERPLSRADQVTRFLMRHEHCNVPSAWAWAQLLYQEPDEGVLCEGMKKMQWMLKHGLIKELHKTTGYYPVLCTLKGHSRNVTSIAWSPDNKLVASGSWDQTIRIWDVATGKEAMGPLKGHSSYVTSVAWSPDGKLVASGSWDETIRIWDVATGKEAMGPLKGHSDWVFSVAWSPDGKLVASGSQDKTIRIWDVATGKEAMGPLKGHSGNPESSVKCLAAMQSYFMRENYHPFVGDEGGWMELDDDGLISKGHLKQLLLDPDLNLGQEDIEALDVESLFAYLLTLDESQGESVRKDVFNKALEKADTSAITYNPKPRLKCSLTGHSNSVYSVAWSPCGKFVASGSGDKTIKIWHAETGSVKCSLKGHSKDNLECTCTHQEASRENHYTSYVANPECPVTGHSGLVYSVAWSPCGNFVASGNSDGTIKIWDALTGSEKCSLKGHSCEVLSVAWSPDGKQVASSSADRTIRIWDVATGKEAMGPLTGHWDWVISVAWSPDGKLVASGSTDETIRIWDAATGMETMDPLRGLPSSWVDVGPEVRALAQQVGQASDDLMACAGNYVVTAHGDTVRICEVLEGRESDGESDDEETEQETEPVETEPVAMFRCPSRVHAVACRPPYICAGCVGGQVLLLEAPFLCEGPGI